MVSDEELLTLVREERRQSIGFGAGDGGELVETREQALKYARGEMDDVPALANRSKAVSTDVAEAVETVLPDVLDIFVAGDDVATFIPTSAEDEQQAQDETDLVNHVVFTENEGFLTLYTAFKDALLLRTGLFHWHWEEEEDKDEISGPGPDVAAQLMQSGADLTDAEMEDQGDGTVTVSIPYTKGRVCIESWPPEDFTVSPLTVSLRDAPYCCARSRRQVQELIADGVDPEKARELPPHAPLDTVGKDRDEANENDQTPNGNGDLKVVEVRDHYIRLLDEGENELKLWRVMTDAEETVILEKEEVPAVPFGALTPYIVAHRFYGESIADKVFEVQRIKTALLRMHLDSGYFALNQRMEVAVSKANEFTIADLLRNEPNMPVRSATGDAVRPLSAGGLAFDPLAALEYASTMIEQRTGIVRNAQGLNPDTLHDTAKGALALMSHAQKRVRLIARIFAETGVKDLFLGVRDTLRRAYQQEGKKVRPINAQIRNDWKTIDPSTWPERNGMAIQVGVGSAGREHDLIVATQALQITEQLVASGLGGVLVKPENIYNRLKKWSQAAGEKNPELYWSDPAQAEPQPPKPDPEMAKAQAQMQLEQAKAQGQLQLAHAQAQSDAQLQASKIEADGQAAIIKAQRDHELAMAKLQAEIELKKYQTDQELELKREQLAAELQLKRELGLAQASVSHEVGMAKVNASTSQVDVGGEPG